MVIFEIEDGTRISVNSESFDVLGGVYGLSKDLYRELRFTTGMTGHGAVRLLNGQYYAYPEDLEAGLSQLSIDFTVEGEYSEQRTKVDPDLLY